MGHELESEIGPCRVTSDLDVLWGNPGGHEVFNGSYSLSQLSWECGRWKEGCKHENKPSGI